MIFKKGVKVAGAKPELLLGLSALEAALREVKGLDYQMVVTSIGDGKHKTGSRHYLGLAADIRSRGLSDAEIEQALLRGKTYLTDEFDLIHEYPGLPKQHFHLEFDPK